MSIVPSRLVSRRAVDFFRTDGAPRLASAGLIKVFVVQRTFSTNPPPAATPPSDSGLPSHVVPSVADFRIQEFKLTGMASRMRQQKQRLIEEMNAQGATAEVLKQREAAVLAKEAANDIVKAYQVATAEALKRREAAVLAKESANDKVKAHQGVTAEALKRREAAVLAKESANDKVTVDLVFELHGVRINLATLTLQRSDFNKLKSIQEQLKADQRGICCLGIDRDTFLMILKTCFDKQSSDSNTAESSTRSNGSGYSTGSGSGPSGSSGGDSGQGSGSYEWDFNWFWQVLGKGSGISTAQWALGLLLCSVDWFQIFLYILVAVEAGFNFHWCSVRDYLANLVQVFKESVENDTTSKFAEAWRRSNGASPVTGSGSAVTAAAEAEFTAKVAAEAGFAKQAAAEAGAAAKVATEAGASAKAAAEAGAAAKAAAEAGAAAKAAAEAGSAAKEAGEAALAARAALEACLPARLAAEAARSARVAARSARVAATEASNASRIAAASKDCQTGSNGTA